MKLNGPKTRSKKRRLQEETQINMSLCMTQKRIRLQDLHILTTTIMAQIAQLNLELQRGRESKERIERLTQDVSGRLENLERHKHRERRTPSIHESERSYKEDGGVFRAMRLVRRNRENVGSKEMDELKVKILPFVGESNLNHYLE
ncbi:hypothetical protein CR513_30660, partial [Mucuna pruriens]